MSKSDENEKNVIFILDEPKKIQKKILRAVTDSGSQILHDPEKRPGLSNLLTIFSTLSEKNIADICCDYEGKLYGQFKKDLADLLVETLNPIQKKYHDLMKDPSFLKSILKKGTLKARAKACETLKEVYACIGIDRS